MARINNLSNFLTDVATAIKNKKGSQTAIPAANFDTEITNLPSQGVYQHKTATVAENGTITILPDTGYDAIDQLDLTVNIPLQQKTYTFTQNTTTTITPEQGYAGFSQVGLEINVPSSQINNQDKTVTQNGQYTADSGYTGLGTVTVNVPQTGIKQFATEQAMQADSDPHEGDLAVVYRQSLNSVAVDSVFNNCIIKQSVTLSAAISDWIWCDFRSVDESMWMPRVSVEVGPESARISVETETDYTTYEYETEDSITYTLTGYNNDQVVDLGADVHCSFSEEWSDDIGLFLYISGGTFEGLYECGRVPIQLKGNLLSDLTVTDNNISTNRSITVNISYDELVERILSMATYIKTLYSHDGYSRYPFWCGLKDANTIVLLSSGSGSTPTSVMYLNPIFKYDTGVFVGMETSSNGSNNAYEFSFNINTGDYINTTVVPLSLTNPDGNWHWNYTTDFNNYYMLGVIDYNSMNETFTWMDKYVYCLSDTIYSSTSSNTPSVIEGLKYNFATTQLTLSNPNELLPNKIGYGKNGIVTGDGSIYNHLDLVSYITSKNNTFAPICADMNFTGKGLNIETLPTEHSINCGVSIYNTLNLEGLSEAASYNGGCTGTQNYFLYWFNNDAPYNITIYNLKGEIVFEDNPFGFTDRPSGLRFAENPNNINDIIAMYSTKLCHINTNTGTYTEPVDIGMSCTELRYDINDNGRFYAIYIPYGSAGLKIYDSSTDSIYTYSCSFGFNDGANVYQDDDYVYTTASAGEKSGSSVGVRHCTYNKSTHQISILFEDSTNKMPLLYDMYNNNVYFHNTSNNKIYSVSGTTMTEFSSNTSGVTFNTYNSLCCVYNSKIFILYGSKLYDTTTGTYMNIVTNYNRTTYNGIGVLDTAWIISSSNVKRFVFKPMYDIIADTSNNFILDFNSNNGGTFHDGIIIYNG